MSERDYVIHNCHAHAFTIDYIPKYFLSRFFPTSWAKKRLVAQIGSFLFKDKINRYQAFFYSALKENHLDVLGELVKYYPRTAKMVVLSVDFDYMDAGSCKYPFLSQIEHLKEAAETINEEYGFRKIIPFLGVDPRRPGLLDLVKKYIEEKQFGGLKLYPGLGFFPNDDRLDPIYKYCEAHAIPITAHCLPVNKNHFRHKITADMLRQAREVSGFNEKYKKRKRLFAKYLNHPYWYGKVLDKFPKLKVNLAHFGGNEEWDKYLDEASDSEEEDMNWYSLIRDLLKEHPNLYADISFTVHDRKLYPLLKNLLNSNYTRSPFFSPSQKILFGTDFYMLQKDYKERRFGIDLRGYLTDDEFWIIAEDNPKRFLANNIHAK